MSIFSLNSVVTNLTQSPTSKFTKMALVNVLSIGFSHTVRNFMFAQIVGLIHVTQQ